MKMPNLNIYLSLIALMFSFNARAELTPGARYFTGEVKIHLSPPSTCYVEVIYSPDLSNMTVRSISTLQHLSTAGDHIWIALGPYTANYSASGSIYRYQDGYSGATVKDLVVYTNGQTTPIKHGVLYWHAEAGHHDPVFCENLVEAITPDQLAAVDEVFADFDNLKP